MSSNQPNNTNQIAGALTFPSRSDGNVQPVPEQPRQPRNLQGLLRFAMEATKAEDAPGNSELGPLDDERRKFLEEALKSLTVDVAQIIQNAINILKDAEKIHSIQLGETLPNDVQTAFNNLLEFIDDLDIANDLYKMGGFAIFPVCYGSDNEDVRALASQVLGELCQNNPYCQAQALESGLLNVLLNLIESEKGNALAKCVFALSCACREFEPACREVISQGGCVTLASLLRTAEGSAKTKAAFFIRYLAHQYPDAKAQFIEQNLVRTITEEIKKGRDDTTEHLLSILVSLVEDLDATVLRQCTDKGLGLKKALEDHLKRPELVGDTYVEEKEYCQELLKVFGSNQQSDGSNEDGADR